MIDYELIQCLCCDNQFVKDSGIKTNTEGILVCSEECRKSWEGEDQEEQFTLKQYAPEQVRDLLLPLLKEVNGWQLWKNNSGFSPPSFTKPWVLIHPIHSGNFFAEFDTEEEARTYATVERFEEWEKELRG